MDGDHFIAKNNVYAMMTITKRVSRYTILVTMPESDDSQVALAGLVHGIEQVPEHLRLSITFDQGSHRAKWRDLV